jgi:hypothetical protein
MKDLKYEITSHTKSQTSPSVDVLESLVPSPVFSVEHGIVAAEADTSLNEQDSLFNLFKITSLD